MINQIEERMSKGYIWVEETLMGCLSAATRDVSYLLEDRERLLQVGVDLQDKVIDQAHERERLCKKCSDQEGEILRLKVELRRAR